MLSRSRIERGEGGGSMPGGRRGGGVRDVEKSTRMRHKTRKFLLAPVPGATLGQKVVFPGAPQAKSFVWIMEQKSAQIY